MLTIYGVPISVHTRKVIVAAHVKGLEFELVPVVPVIPDNPPPNWSDLSPSRRIPALTHNGFTVSDSAAICAYLERCFPEPRLYPSEARDYAKVIAMESYASEILFGRVVRPLFHETFVHPQIEKRASDQKVITDVLNNQLPVVFGYLDRSIEGQYLFGSALSVADLAIVSNLMVFQYMGFELDGDRFPRLAAHFKTMMTQPAVAKALADERETAAAMGLKTGFLEKAA